MQESIFMPIDTQAHIYMDVCMYVEERIDKGMQITAHVILLIQLDFSASLIFYYPFLFFTDIFWIPIF